MPPPTLASKPMAPPPAAAAPKTSSQAWASSALFAVTTHLPRRSASRMNSFAGESPPISSTTIGIDGSSISARASLVSSAGSTATPRSLVVSLSAIRASVERETEALADDVGVLLQDAHDALADRAETDETDLH